MLERWLKRRDQADTALEDAKETEGARDVKERLAYKRESVVFLTLKR